MKLFIFTMILILMLVTYYFKPKFDKSSLKEAYQTNSTTAAEYEDLNITSNDEVTEPSNSSDYVDIGDL